MATTPPVSGEVFYARTVSVLTLILLGVLAYRILAPMFAALAWAALIAVLLYPLQVRLTRLLRARDTLAAGVLASVTVLFVLGPVTALAAAFAVQVDELLELAAQIARQEAQGAGAASGWLQLLLSRMEITFGVTPPQVREWIGEAAKAGLQLLAGLGGKIFVGALGTAFSFTVSMFVLFFLLRDGARMLITVRGLIPMSEADKRRLFTHLESVIQAVIYGSGLTALVQGALLGIGFALLGLPAPVVFGVLGAILALLPVVGTPLIWGPAVVMLATQDRWVAATILLVWGILVSTVDNVLRPILVSGRARIGALTVFLGVIGGVAAFGTVGLFLGPVVLSLCLALVRFSLEQRQLREAEAARAPPEE
jgi:predicted PurR-regulated permease PerM